MNLKSLLSGFFSKLKGSPPPQQSQPIQTSPQYYGPVVQFSGLPQRTFTAGTKPYQNRLRRRFIAVDFETSGLNRTSDRIIEIGAVRFENGREIDSFSCLVKSVPHIPAVASAVNHITDEDLRLYGLTETDAFHRFIDWLGEEVFTGFIPLVSHNARFDMAFLENTLDRLCIGLSGDIRYFDTLTLSRRHLSLPDYKQDTVAQAFGIVNPDAHRAVTDARTCGLIMLQLFGPMGIQLYTEPIPRSYQPTEQDRQVCAAIRQTMQQAGLDDRFVRFEKHATGTVWVKSPREFVGFAFKGSQLFFYIDVRDYVPCALTCRSFEHHMGSMDLLEIPMPNLWSISMLTAPLSAGLRRVYPEQGEFSSLPSWIHRDAEKCFIV